MIDEREILDSIIEDLKTKREASEDFNERMKLTDRLLKAIAMRRKEQAKKGRGFDLGVGNGQPSSRN